MQSDYRIRVMRRNEVGVAIDWAAREGWNPGLHDAACFAAAESDGFFVGELDGAAVAVISAVKYESDRDDGDGDGDGAGAGNGDDGAGDGGDGAGGGDFGFIGLYIVAPAMRGRGYGLAIWRAAMQRLRGCNIGLDGVVAQQENYRKSGFRLAHRNVRYAGIAGRSTAAGAKTGGKMSGAAEVVELSEVPFAVLAAYDRRMFPAPRAAFLRAWIQQPDSAALGVLSGGELAGYGVLRRCRAGHKIGPLFADTPALAEQLFAALCARAAPGASVYLDIPAPNSQALKLARTHGMRAVFETARMYTGAPPALPLDKIFGITTFELG
ncbi:MAG: GNAT family N-acetyltransferase [Gammaproteobacteria bacterium]|nr:GNAT family N-acetyltransferase [Gammaproteobacteria bacterium]